MRGEGCAGRTAGVSETSLGITALLPNFSATFICGANRGPPVHAGGFFFGREAVRPFFFDVGALRGMSSNIDAIGTSRTWQISYSRAALIRLMPFSYF
jgi:hypothetical protein